MLQIITVKIFMMQKSIQFSSCYKTSHGGHETFVSLSSILSIESLLRNNSIIFFSSQCSNLKRIIRNQAYNLRKKYLLIDNKEKHVSFVEFKWLERLEVMLFLSVIRKRTKGCVRSENLRIWSKDGVSKLTFSPIDCIVTKNTSEKTIFC